MTDASEAPRGFLPAAVVWASTVFSLSGFVDDGIYWGIVVVGLLILGAWFVVTMKDRPRPRYARRHSAPYFGWFAMLFVAFMGAGFWRVDSWTGVGLKWVALTVVLSIALTGMRSALRTERVRAAHEPGR